MAIINKILVFIVLLTLIGCPIDPCIGNVRNTTIPDLIKISPLQSNYLIGEEIEISMILPSENILLNGESYDVYEDTSIDLVDINIVELYKFFQDNTYQIIEGDYDDYFAKLIYYADENEYRFKANISLSNPGTYSIHAKGSIFFRKDDSACTALSIDTNIEGMDENNVIEFVVE